MASSLNFTLISWPENFIFSMIPFIKIGTSTDLIARVGTSIGNTFIL